MDRQTAVENKMSVSAVDFALPHPYTLREIEAGDVDKGYFDLLSHLTSAPKLAASQFAAIIAQQHRQAIHTYVIENVSTHLIVASASLIVEPKLTHNGASVGHIEDVVVHAECRGLRFGALLIAHLRDLAVHEKGCYKVILDCAEKAVPFYEKCGFARAELQMRFNSPL